jgi:hypothetical protein
MMGMTKPKAVEALLNSFMLNGPNVIEQYMEAYDAKLEELFATETKI